MTQAKVESIVADAWARMRDAARHRLRTPSPADDADDVVSEAVMATWERFGDDGTAKRDNILRYLYRCTQYITARYNRRHYRDNIRRRPFQETLIEYQIDNLISESNFQIVFWVFSLAKQHLSARHYIILDLRYRAGYGYAEIAAEMDLENAAAARQLMKRAKEKLLEILRKLPPPDDPGGAGGRKIEFLSRLKESMERAITMRSLDSPHPEMLVLDKLLLRGLFFFASQWNQLDNMKSNVPAFKSNLEKLEMLSLIDEKTSPTELVRRAWLLTKGPINNNNDEDGIESGENMIEVLSNSLFRLLANLYAKGSLHAMHYIHDRLQNDYIDNDNDASFGADPIDNDKDAISVRSSLSVDPSKIVLIARDVASKIAIAEARRLNIAPNRIDWEMIANEAVLILCQRVKEGRVKNPEAYLREIVRSRVKKEIVWLVSTVPPLEERDKATLDDETVLTSVLTTYGDICKKLGIRMFTHEPVDNSNARLERFLERQLNEEYTKN